MLQDVFATPPDAVNEIGVKFWVDKDLTRYAINKGLSLVQVLFVEEPDGTRTRLLVQNGIAVDEDQTLEGMAAKIDFIALDRGLK